MDNPLVLYDGVCHLCNGSVRFIIKRDPQGKFQFGQLQSDAVRQRLEGFPAIANNLKTLVLLEGGKMYTQSTAALRIARHLSGGWPLFYGFIVIPAFIRNALYDLISRHRYRWFGKSDHCVIPAPADRGRFID